MRSAGTAFLCTWLTACNSILGIGDPKVKDAAAESNERDTSVEPENEAGHDAPVDAPSPALETSDATTEPEANADVERDDREAAPSDGDREDAATGSIRDAAIEAIPDAATETIPDAGSVGCSPQPCSTALLPENAGFAPENFAQDDTYLYWTEFIAGRIGRTHKQTGDTHLLWSTVANPDGIAVDETSVYWVDNLPGVWRCPKDGCGGGPQLVSNSVDQPYQVAVDDRNVYWTDKHNLAVRTAPKDGVDAAFTTLWQSGTTTPWHIAADGQGRLFFTVDDGRLYRMNVDGGAPTPFAGAGVADAGSGIALDINAAYWAVRDPTAGTVNAVAKDGTRSTTLAASQPAPRDLASDGFALYWINPGPDGAILKCEVARCVPTPVVQHIVYPAAILVDQVAIYWIQANTPLGSIWRMDK